MNSFIGEVVMGKGIQNSFEQVIYRLGLVVLLALGFFNSFGAADFAKIAFFFPGLDFPVFIGEIGLASCLIAIIILLILRRINFQRWYLLVILWGTWILVRAITGYMNFGPVSFRSAALFYYSLFAFCGYCLFDRSFFSSRLVPWAIVVTLLAMSVYPLDLYHAVPCVLLLLVLSTMLERTWLRWAVWASLAVYVVASKILFWGSRSHIFGLTVLALYGVSVVAVHFFQSKVNIRGYFFLFVTGALFFSGIFFFADPNALKTVFSPGKVVQEFQAYDQIIKKEEPNFSFCPLSPKLYHQNPQEEKSIFWLAVRLPVAAQGTSPSGDRPLGAAFSGKPLPVAVQGAASSGDQSIEAAPLGNPDSVTPLEKAPLETAAVRDASSETGEQALQQPAGEQTPLAPIVKQEHNGVQEARKIPEVVLHVSFQNILRDSSNEPRDLDIAYNNINFRLFIWRDMMRELIEQHALWGIDFGRPLRSKSIEILHWAESEWSRDGWITPHNSYLDMIYRGGIIGLIFVILIVVGLWRLTRDFLRYRSLPGILLVSALLYWAAISNFLVFLEVPYGAIPFWSLLGMLYAYRQNVRVSFENSHRS